MPTGILVTHSQLGHLADASGGRVLVALPAGLRVVKRSEAVVNLLHFAELARIEVMRGLVHHPIAEPIEAAGGLGGRVHRSGDGNGRDHHRHKEKHQRSLPASHRWVTPGRNLLPTLAEYPLVEREKFPG